MNLIGIDIGGTKTAIGLIDAAGILRNRTTLPTLSGDGFHVDINRIEQEIRQLTGNVSAIGIGCAGPVDPRTGVVHNPHTLPGWENHNLIEALGEAFGCPVALENDVDAAVLGERWRGAAKDCDHVAMLTLGTGVGFGAIVDGQVYRGRDGEHPEFGHVPVDPAGPKCYCGLNGCVESVAAGPALDAAAQVAGLTDARELFATDDPRAKPILEAAKHAVFIAAWTLLHSFVPARILLGGGLGQAHYDRFARPIQRAIDQAALLPTNKPTLAPAALGNDAGLIGGGYLAKQLLND